MKLNRKLLVLIIAVVTALAMAGCSGADNVETRYTFPGEWEQHEGTWLIWPHDNGLITPETVDEIEHVWVTMTKELHTGEKVHIVVYDEDVKQHVTDLLTAEGVDMAQVDFTVEETDQFWARDCGPMFVRDAEGNLAVADFGYNGYGRMYKLGPDVPEDYRWETPDFVRIEYLENFTKDDVLAASIGEAMGLETVDVNEFVVEGGALELDGKGTLITTESCVLNENRNSGMNRSKAEKYFNEYLGVTNVIWLEGSPDEDITDGHIDGLMRFADSETIVTMSKEDYFETYDYTPEGDYEKIINAVNADGEKYKIVELPITKENVKSLGWRANYMNYYAGNEVVLVPVYGDVMDAEAVRILGEIYPDKKIVPVDGEILAVVGGGIHCVTQQQPL